LSSVMVIGDIDTVTGFRLAGVAEAYVHEDAARTQDLIRASLQRDVAVLIITERAAEDVRTLVDRLRSRKGIVKPVIVEIPDKKGPLGKEDLLRKMIRRIVGTEVTLEEKR